MGLMISTFIFILSFYFLRFIYLLIFMILFSFWTVFFNNYIFSFLRRFHSSLQQTYVCYVRLVRERVPKAVKKAIFASTMKARTVTSANLVR